MIELVPLFTASGLALVVAVGVVLFTRIILAAIGKSECKGTRNISALIVFGSGGHTGEMIKLLENFDRVKYSPLYFLLAHSDTTSKARLLRARGDYAEGVEWLTIHRSREVKQSLFSSVFSTLVALKDSVLVVTQKRPELIICNGPGTCVPICYAAYFMRLMGIYKPRIIFVESFCRVKSLSMSGRLLYPIVDGFVVHWPELLEKYPRAEFLGKLC